MGGTSTNLILQVYGKGNFNIHFITLNIVEGKKSLISKFLFDFLKVPHISEMLMLFIFEFWLKIYNSMHLIRIQCITVYYTHKTKLCYTKLNLKKASGLSGISSMDLLFPNCTFLIHFGYEVY